MILKSKREVIQLQERVYRVVHDLQGEDEVQQLDGET